MPYKTRLLVYVDADIMNSPHQLFDAILTHMIKKGIDTGIRKQFIAEFMRAITDELKLKVVYSWVQIRDVNGFPFANKKHEQLGKGEQLDESEQLGKGEQSKEEQPDANTEIGRGVPVDNQPDREQKQGDSPDRCNTGYGQDTKTYPKQRNKR